MKKFLFIAVALLLSVPALKAQDNNEAKGERPNFDKMIEKQAERLATDLALKDDISAKFIPLYTEYRKEQMNIMRSGMQGRGQRDKVQTDEEVEARILAGFARDRKSADLKESYYVKFRDLLGGPKAVQKMYMLERRSQMPQGGPGGQGGYPGGGRPGGMGGNGGGYPGGGRPGGMGGNGSFGGGDF